MPSIHVLSPHIANQIAAGEVVERPSSVVKELVENAVDAHATSIVIEIENGGIDRIEITDNGTGIADEDCETAFLRHATSKISAAEDLFRISTLGFRGEALASIAAISRVTLTTRTANDELGTRICCEGGQLKEHARVGGPVGTRICVDGLFYNVPARLKFLKSSRAESGAVGDYVAKLILSLPEVAIRFISNGRTVYQSAGDGSLINALVTVYGVEIAPHLCPVAFDDGYLKIEGFVGTPELCRANRTGQSFFLNGRLIRSNALSAALGRAFDTRLMQGRYPFAALSLQIAYAEVDVNVHPAKLEVRFVDESRVARSVCVACSEALIRSYVPSAQLGTDIAVSSAANADVPADRLQFAPNSPGFSRSDTSEPQRPAQMLGMGEERSTATGPVDLRAPFERDSYRIREALYGSELLRSGEHAGSPTFHPDRGDQGSLFLNQGTSSDAAFSAPYSIVGVAFATYWFVQQGDALYCIDQHAAHERLLYDALQRKSAQVISQALLMPEKVTLAPSDYVLYCEKKTELEEFGYVFAENASENQVTLAAVPQLNGTALRAAFLLDVLHDRDVSRERLMQSACKHAIKAGEPISHEEINALLQELQRTDSLLTCPHGRPVAVRIMQRDLEKLFKRVL